MSIGAGWHHGSLDLVKNESGTQSGDSGIVPSQRLWTPWRMAYVGGAAEPGCVFCNALTHLDDVASLIVHRGEHAFVILNLYPYNTGHLMVVTNEHVHDPAALSTAARSEIAELTALFCTGLRLVMGCDGLNIGMNLGAVAGAGIADHLHQHIVPRWTGDANFMPIVAGTKVLPELLPATYARIRAEVARQHSSTAAITLVLFNADRSGIFVEHDALPRITVTADAPVATSVMSSLAPLAERCELLGWGGSSPTVHDAHQAPALVLCFAPTEMKVTQYRLWSIDQAGLALPDGDLAVLAQAIERFI